jgi:ABC-2 type transport system permease protein
LGKIRAIIWLHTLRTRRYFLSMASGSLTDTLWIITLLLGFTLTGKTHLLPENFLGLVAWTIASNATWMIGGWVDYLSVLRLIEEHEARGTHLLLVLAGRVIPLLTTSAITSLLTLLFLKIIGLEIPALYPTYTIASLCILLIQSVEYGLLLANLALKTGVPGYMLDIASLAFLGLAIMPVEENRLRLLAPVPLLGPMLAAKASSKQPVNSDVLASLLLSTLLVTFVLLAASKKVMSDARRRGIKTIGEV